MPPDLEKLLSMGCKSISFSAREGNDYKMRADVHARCMCVFWEGRRGPVRAPGHILSKASE